MAIIDRQPASKKAKIVAACFFAIILIFSGTLIFYNLFGFHDKSVMLEGTTSANLMNGGAIYRNGDGTVFFSKSDGLYIYNQTDLTTKKIFDKPAVNIGAIKNTIYFEADKDYYSCLYNGLKITKIISGGSNYEIEGSYIYYIDNQTKALKKVRTDQKLSFTVKTAEPINFQNGMYNTFIVNSGQIIYKTSGGLCMCNTDGSNNKSLYKGDVKVFFVELAALFVQNSDGNVYICDMGGKPPEPLVNADKITIFGDSVVYTKNNKIYFSKIADFVISSSGTQNKPLVLATAKTNGLYNFNKVIYYTNEKNELYMCTLNGINTKIA